MIYDVLNLIVTLAWLALGIAALRQLVRGARKSRRVFTGLRTLVSYRWLIYILSVSGLTLVKASLVFVYPQDTGVVVSIFSQQGVRQQPLRGGLHWLIPLAERLAVYPLYWQTYDMSRQPTRYHGGDTMMARTRDGQEVALNATVIFRIDPERVVPIHIQWQDRYLRDFVHPTLRGVLREQISRYTVEELNSAEREELIERMERQLRKVGEENGLIIQTFLARNLGFLRGYADSVEQKQVALEKRQTKEYQAGRIEILARGQEQRIKLLAEARARAVVIKAEARKRARIIRKKADADALRLVKATLRDHPQMQTYRYIEQLSPKTGVVVIKNGGSSVMLR